MFFFIGGPLDIFCGILEFFLGNTFPFAVFTTYGTSPTLMRNKGIQETRC